MLWTALVLLTLYAAMFRSTLIELGKSLGKGIIVFKRGLEEIEDNFPRPLR